MAKLIGAAETLKDTFDVIEHGPKVLPKVAAGLIFGLPGAIIAGVVSNEGVMAEIGKAVKPKRNYDEEDNSTD